MGSLSLSFLVHVHSLLSKGLQPQDVSFLDVLRLLPLTGLQLKEVPPPGFLKTAMHSHSQECNCFRALPTYNDIVAMSV